MQGFTTQRHFGWAFNLCWFTSLAKGTINGVQATATIIQSVERPSKVSVWCDSTDMSWIPSSIIGVRKNPSSPMFEATIEVSFWFRKLMRKKFTLTTLQGSYFFVEVIATTIRRPRCFWAKFFKLIPASLVTEVSCHQNLIVEVVFLDRQNLSKLTYVIFQYLLL